MKFKKILDNFSFSDMKRRSFVATAIAGLALSTLFGCQSKEDPLRGKWQSVKTDERTGESYAEFLGDRTAIFTFPKFNISSVYEYKIIEGNHLSLQSKQISLVEIYSFRFDQGYLFIRNANDDRETQYKRI